MTILTKNDIFGGITAAVVALPLALAFGVQSGLGAEAGIYGAIVLGIFAALFGGTTMQVSGPTGPMTVLSAALIAQLLAYYGSIDAALPAILMSFVLAGMFQILFGLFKLGNYVKFIPYPVISGFMSGVGILIITFQLYPLIGHAIPHNIGELLSGVGDALAVINLEALLLGSGTVLLIYLLPRIVPQIPAGLTALFVMTGLAMWWGGNVPTVGPIAAGLPAWTGTVIMNIAWADLPLIVVPALMLAALGSLDSLMGSIVADSLTKTRHRSNKELIGQGIGNIGSACFGGLPGAGATMRTIANIKAGGRNRASGVIHGLVLIAVLLGAGEYAQHIPLAVLAGILITVGISIMDLKGLRHLHQIPRGEAFVILAVLSLTVFVSLLHAVVVGMILAAFLFMKKMADWVERSSFVTPLAEYSVFNAEQNLENMYAKEVYVKHLSGPMFFGFATQLRILSEEIPDVRWVVFHMKDVSYVDESGLYALQDAIDALKTRNIEVLLVAAPPYLHESLRRVGVIPTTITEQQLFKDLDSCASWLHEQAK